MGYLPSYEAETTSTNPTNNYVSTTDTIAKMVQLVMESISSPLINSVGEQILQAIGKQNPTQMDIARAVFWYAKHHVQFKEDEYSLIEDFGITDLGTGKELLLAPAFLLSMQVPKGDCDDFSTLIASLLKVLRFRKVGFRTVAADKHDPKLFTHVYVITEMGDGNVFALDGSHGMYPGWEVQTIYKYHDWWF